MHAGLDELIALLFLWDTLRSSIGKHNYFIPVYFFKFIVSCMFQISFFPVHCLLNFGCKFLNCKNIVVTKSVGSKFSCKFIIILFLYADSFVGTSFYFTDVGSTAFSINLNTKVAPYNSSI